MGVFSTNSHLGSSVELTPNENYFGEAGAIQIMIENEQNSQLMFEAVIGMDFQEAVAVREGAEVEILTEGAITDFVAKVKEVFKKVCEKIKGVFNSFIARLRGVVTKDNKKFLDKYKATVVKKDLSKMKFKWSAPKDNDFVAEDKLNEIEAGLSVDLKKIAGMDSKALDNHISELNDGTVFEEMAAKVVGEKVEAKEFSKAFHEMTFEDEDEVEGVSANLLGEIMSILSNNKLISDFQKQIKNVDKLYNSVSKQLDKASTAIAKGIPGEGSVSASIKLGDDDSVSVSGNSNTTKQLAMKKVTTMSKAVAVTQKLSAMTANEVIKATKFHIGQCRRVFAKAAAFNPKSVKESAVFAEAFGSAEEYDVLSLLD